MHNIDGAVVLNDAAMPQSPMMLPININNVASRCPTADRDENKQAGRPLKPNMAIAESIIFKLNIIIFCVVQFVYGSATA